MIGWSIQRFELVFRAAIIADMSNKYYSVNIGWGPIFGVKQLLLSKQGMVNPLLGHQESFKPLFERRLSDQIFLSIF